MIHSLLDTGGTEGKKMGGGCTGVTRYEHILYWAEQTLKEQITAAYTIFSTLREINLS